ncbi:hypothetical protein CEUSTIGMA_g2190.t1 [Chlamydomonas eustigma]|uniref:Uncharacterized protein n=1 Tax=Chlamydomonas eustigma TaxID=1157962 RepID=A0A250WV77_9CHLO|nr:hypothetical protein CEUSTIGMA_g2190.t1 [Chlamydomonas eustigma]|eukprot:GAX74743.1 hypothetical protein CEUSTIGMA_g2190.t1 [Chlamydomonas eustigma]
MQCIDSDSCLLFFLFRPQLPKVEPDLYIMALLLYLEKLGISHQIITRVQSLVVRGPSAFDWRNLHLPPDVKRAAATEVRSTSLSWNSFSAGPPEGGDDGMNEVDKGSRLRTLGRANTMVTMWRGAGEDRQLSGRRTCRQVWLQFLAGAL